MHIEQSFVGKVLSSWAIVPPMLGVPSSMYTLYPESARSRAACMPAGPPPTMRTAPTVFSSVIQCRLLPYWPQLLQLCHHLLHNGGELGSFRACNPLDLESLRLNPG